MPGSTPDVLTASRLPMLCRGVCLYAGLPLPPATAPGERFVVRTGAEPPHLLARLLEEGFVEDGIEVRVGEADDGDRPAARVVVRPGYEAACPDVEDLRRAAAAGGPVLLFAVERRDPGGRLLGVTWAAVPEEEPPPEGRFRAAVKSYDQESGVRGQEEDPAGDSCR